MEEKEKMPFNEEVYRKIFATSGMPYPEEKIKARLHDPRAVDLHNRAKEYYAKYKRIAVASKSGRYPELQDTRFARLSLYFMKDEVTPEDIEYNKKFIEELNTPSGAQAFANRLTKMFMEQDPGELIATDLEDMTEKFLTEPEPKKAYLLFAVKDLFNGDHTAGHPLFSIDPDIQDIMNEKISALQAGQIPGNAVALMAQDSWAVMDAVQGPEMENLIPGIAIEVAESNARYGKGNVLEEDEKPYHKELATLVDNMNIVEALQSAPTMKAMADAGLMKDGQRLFLNGQETKRSDVQKEIDAHKANLKDVKVKPIENYAETMEKVRNLPKTADAVRNMDNFLADMETSQRKIWGKGSQEFRDLMDSVKEYNAMKKSSKNKGLTGSKEMMDKLREIQERAKAYLDMKKPLADSDSLNENGKIRYDLVTRLAKLTSGVLGEEQAEARRREEAKKQAEAQKKAKPAPEKAKNQMQKDMELTDQDRKDYQHEKLGMEIREKNLPEGPEKMVARMAIEAKDRLFQMMDSAHPRPYPEMNQDMKIMIFDRLLQNDTYRGASVMAMTMANKGVKTPEDALKFMNEEVFKAEGVKKVMGEFDKATKPYRADDGKLRYHRTMAPTLKSFAVKGGDKAVVVNILTAVKEAAIHPNQPKGLQPGKELQQQEAPVKPGGPGLGGL